MSLPITSNIKFFTAASVLVLSSAKLKLTFVKPSADTSLFKSVLSVTAIESLPEIKLPSADSATSFTDKLPAFLKLSLYQKSKETLSVPAKLIS